MGWGVGSRKTSCNGLTNNSSSNNNNTNNNNTKNNKNRSTAYPIFRKESFPRSSISRILFFNFWNEFLSTPGRRDNFKSWSLWTIDRWMEALALNWSFVVEAFNDAFDSLLLCLTFLIIYPIPIQRTLSVWGSIIVQLVSSFTSMDSTAALPTNNSIFLVSYSLVKLETNCAVIQCDQKKITKCL